MPKIVERYRDNLILCSRCKRYLPRESFFERFLRDSQFECKECHRKYVNDYNRKHGVKSWEERKKEREQNKQKDFLSEPYQKINQTIERLVKERGEYQQKEDHVCGFCHQLAYLGFNQRYFCKRHWLIEALSMGKPLPTNTREDSPELARKLRILKELEGLGVQLD